MYTINQDYTFEQIINKSRFICYLFPVTTVEEANQKLIVIRKLHYTATHNCYGYIIGESGNIAKSSDDGEPSQTAGIVIYDVLKKNNLTNVLAIVTRYFGGIKLGAGGLVRAYSSSVSKTIENIELIPIIKKIKLKITFSYEYLNSINKFMDNYELLNKDYSTNVTLEYLIPEEKKDQILEELISITKNSIFITIN